mmetsp:Transcript_8810/g.13035  ORF Transcript_8810/g.13035 Transcript_8810/m.13035 type:complete len:265 (-) Transcript_8810:175-969(-)
MSNAAAAIILPPNTEFSTLKGVVDLTSVNDSTPQTRFIMREGASKHLMAYGARIEKNHCLRRQKSNCDSKFIEALQEKEWEKALELLQICPEYAKAWRSVTTTNSKSNQNNYNSFRSSCRHPLHVALQQKAPLNIIKAIQTASPMAAQTVIENGVNIMFPLHLSLLHRASDDVVLFLLNEFPSAASIPDQFGMLPIHVACMEGATSAEVVEQLISCDPACQSAVDDRNNTPLFYAGKSTSPTKWRVIDVLTRPNKPVSFRHTIS